MAVTGAGFTFPEAFISVPSPSSVPLVVSMVPSQAHKEGASSAGLPSEGGVPAEQPQTRWAGPGPPEGHPQTVAFVHMASDQSICREALEK